jgi:hypothetical protein
MMVVSSELLPAFTTGSSKKGTKKENKDSGQINFSHFSEFFGNFETIRCENIIL